MKYIFCIAMACLILGNPIQAQDENDTIHRRAIKLYKKPWPPVKGDLFILAMPIVSYNPSNGFMFGAGMSASAFLGNPASTRISSTQASFMYTSKNSYLYIPLRLMMLSFCLISKSGSTKLSQEKSDKISTWA